ncbi:hypothetical protein [Burkholderia glumae]|uniref:hypothetical protein n=1 Tax=Burkholderia glumae TaxID=337 RepID=UPI00156FBC9B|nr:hypothetical protein [Burkholderia glumae]QKM57717.1 hypothetical protein CG017_05797 [Burkholderia glumae]
MKVQCRSHVYLSRFLRMSDLLLRGRISWASFSAAMRDKQVAVPLVGGGMVFCERSTERAFFGEN